MLTVCMDLISGSLLRVTSFGCSGLKCRKTSRRDLPFVIANKLDGSTTVSATMLLAYRAGISLFVTGGMSLDLHETFLMLTN